MSEIPFKKWHKENYEKIQEERKQERTAKPWDILDKSKYGTSELSDKRIEICLSCPQLIKSTKQCKKCGCFMVVKTKLEKSACPIGKW